MANFFNFFKSRREAREVQSQIQFKTAHLENGLYISLYRDSEESTIRLPLELTVSQLREQLRADLLLLLDDLWYDEYLQVCEQGYIISLQTLYELPREIRGALGIPEPTLLDLELAHEGAVGTSHFRYVLEQHHGRWKHLERTAQTNGPWIHMPDQSTLLMEREQFEFGQRLKAMPDPKETSLILPFVAEVRSSAKRMGIPLDPYLEKQDYLFVGSLDLEVNRDEQGIHLRPRYASSDEISAELLEQMSRTDSVYAATIKGQKVFVNRGVFQQAREIREVQPIQGADIPRFVENPEAFLPEMAGLDLSLFGERVRSLGVRVYKAQPFVHASEKERGWFEIDMGFSVKDEQGETHHTLQSQQLLNQIKEAKEKGNSFIEWNGDWLRIPEDAQKFIETAERFKEETKDQRQIDITKLPYILEIFENISQLEYNQPILAARAELQDSGVLDLVPPVLFKATLKPFQQEGYVWMKGLHHRRMGGLLADDMGLGKTIQVVSLLSYLHERGQLTPTLIVVPKTLIDNWENELLKFAPSLLKSFYVHRGPQRIKDPKVLRNIGITITTYQTLVRDQLVFGQVSWQTVICDEAQAIKNPTTSASMVLKAMKSNFRLAMTGTPVENGLSELWSIMDYVQPGILGSLSQFRQNFIAPLENSEASIDVESMLMARIGMFYKRRTKTEELGDQLPSKNITMVNTPLGRVQQEQYQEVLTLVQNKMLDGLQAIQKLKELCSHPALLNEKYMDLPVEEVPKLQKTMEIIESIQARGEKVLIFTEYIRMQELLRRTVRNKFDVVPMIINGMTNRRQEVVDLFNNKSGFDVMILSPKAAGTGLTITSANHVIHYTRWWNPAVENQATDRVYRIGQSKPVTVYLPVVTDTRQFTRQGTVEEIVHRILSEKQELASSVIVSSRAMNIEDEVLKGIR